MVNTKRPELGVRQEQQLAAAKTALRDAGGHVWWDETLPLRHQLEYVQIALASLDPPQPMVGPRVKVTAIKTPAKSAPKRERKPPSKCLGLPVENCTKTPGCRSVIIKDKHQCRPILEGKGQKKVCNLEVLDKMTRKQLRSVARSNYVEGWGQLTKEDLCKFLQDKRNLRPGIITPIVSKCSSKALGSRPASELQKIIARFYRDVAEMGRDDMCEFILDPENLKPLYHTLYNLPGAMPRSFYPYEIALLHYQPSKNRCSPLLAAKPVNELREIMQTYYTPPRSQITEKDKMCAYIMQPSHLAGIYSFLYSQSATKPAGVPPYEIAKAQFARKKL